MTLALFEKTDFSRAVDPLGHDLDGVLHARQPVDAPSADAEAAIAKDGLFEVNIITFEERGVLQEQGRNFH